MGNVSIPSAGEFSWFPWLHALNDRFNFWLLSKGVVVLKYIDCTGISDFFYHTTFPL